MEENWTNEVVKCDLCAHEWLAVYEISCNSLECPNCENMVYFEAVDSSI